MWSDQECPPRGRPTPDGSRTFGQEKGPMAPRGEGGWGPTSALNRKENGSQKRRSIHTNGTNEKRIEVCVRVCTCLGVPASLPKPDLSQT